MTNEKKRFPASRSSSDEPTTIHNYQNLITAALNVALWEDHIPQPDRGTPTVAINGSRDDPSQVESNTPGVFRPRLAKIAVANQIFNIEIRAQLKQQAQYVVRQIHRSQTLQNTWITPNSVKSTALNPPRPSRVANLTVCDPILHIWEAELLQGSGMSRRKTSPELRYVLIVNGLEGCAVQMVVITYSAHEAVGRIFRELANGYSVNFVAAITVSHLDLVFAAPSPPLIDCHRVRSKEELLLPSAPAQAPERDSINVLC